MDTAAIVRSFRGKTATIGVIGLGYVGLPLALTFAGKGFPTVTHPLPLGSFGKLPNFMSVSNLF